MLALRPLSVALDGQELHEGLEVLTEPVGKLRSVDAAGSLCLRLQRGSPRTEVGGGRQ